VIDQADADKQSARAELIDEQSTHGRANGFGRTSVLMTPERDLIGSTRLSIPLMSGNGKHKLLHCRTKWVRFAKTDQ
jgi:hypothetical protein